MSYLSTTSLINRVGREAILMLLALVFASAPFVAAAEAQPATAQVAMENPS
jgi:hypothetical protein